MSEQDSRTENPQIILMALAVLVGAIAFLFHSISDYRKSAMCWHGFQAAKAERAALAQSKVWVSSDTFAAAVFTLAQRSENQTEAGREACLNCAQALAQGFSHENPEFDTEAFLRACGVAEPAAGAFS